MGTRFQKRKTTVRKVDSGRPEVTTVNNWTVSVRDSCNRSQRNGLTGKRFDDDDGLISQIDIVGSNGRVQSTLETSVLGKKFYNVRVLR